MKISLLGYMASGKSVLGKTLSTKYNLPFYDLDKYIELNEEALISELMGIKNGMHFRKLERKYLLEILNKPSFILSVGGGTPCYYDNLEKIKAKSVSFYLSESPKILTERLKLDKAKRPLVANVADEDLLEFVAKHLFERRLFYDQAHHTIIGAEKLNSIIEILRTQ